MHKLHRLSKNGHDTLAEWRPDHPDEVKAAAKVFDGLKNKGMTMFSQDGAGEKLTTFDPSVQEMVAVPQLQGG